MAHGGYGKRRVAGRPPLSSSSSAAAAAVRGGGNNNSSRGLGVRRNTEKKAKIVSIKNQIRSVERLLRKALPLEVKNAQQKRLEDLKKQADLHARAEVERKMALRYRKVKFFERRKVERAIRRLEKLLRATSDNPNQETTRQATEISMKLAQLREDLEYVRFFPKTEKFISLFMGGDDENVVERRNKLREQIKANLAKAAASGVELEETGSEDDGAMDLSEDEFFLVGSSSDDADADDEWTDKSSRPGDDRDDMPRELAPPSPRDAMPNHEQHHHQRLSNLGKAPVHKVAEDRNQRQSSARVLMPPPQIRSRPSSSNSGGFQSKSRHSSSNSSKMAISGPSSSNSGDMCTHAGNNPSSSNSWGITKATTPTVGSSNSDVQQKRRRKRTRPKKKRK